MRTLSLVLLLALLSACKGGERDSAPLPVASQTKKKPRTAWLPASSARAR